MESTNIEEKRASAAWLYLHISVSAVKQTKMEHVTLGSNYILKYPCILHHPGLKSSVWHILQHMVFIGQ